MALRIGVFSSHGGTNLQAILDACAAGDLKASVAVVISNNSTAYALQRAADAGIPTAHLSSVTHPGADALDEATVQTLRSFDVDLVVLAGYMKQLGPKTIDAYRGRIVNTHAALLPKYGGRGMYGDRVHAAVLAAGDTETGVTVHLVDEDYDHGPTIAELRVPVLPGDTVDSVRDRVKAQENSFFVDTLRRIADGEISLNPSAGSLTSPGSTRSTPGDRAF